MSTNNNNDKKPEEVKSSEEAGQDKEKGGFKKRYDNNYGKRNTPKEKFKGMTEGMEGHVFDYGNHVTADAFANTIDQLCTYVGATFKDYGSDIKYVVRNFKLSTIEKPKPLARDADDVDKELSLIHI